MKSEEEIFREERLADLELDMNDDNKSWVEAEKQLIEAKEWRDKMALRYAESSVKYYNYKNEQSTNRTV